MCTLLGRPGDLVPRDGLVDAYTTRIGGTPVLPAGADSLPECSCPHCHKALVLLLQAHAPVAAAQERFIYLLGCASDKCLGAWKALRCQPTGPSRGAAAVPAEPAAGSSGASTRQQQPSTAAPEPGAVAASSWGEAGPTGEEEGAWGGGTSDWGAGGGSAGGGWGEEAADEGSNGSAFDFDDLNAALDAVASKQSAQQAAGAARQQGSAQHPRQAAAAGPAAGDAAGWAGLQACYAGPCLPSFYLTAQPEAVQASQQKLAKKELEHLQQLLSQYEQESGAAVPEPAAAGGGGGAAAAAAAGACLPSIEGGAESWAGEGYEPDAVLHADKARAAGLRPAFIKFSKRLAACPDQCARYSLGGVPLWPSEALPTPQPCTRCGAPASFEVQLMAPAIHYLEESADWLEEEVEGNAEEGAGETEEEGPGAKDTAAAVSTGGGGGSSSSRGILRPPPSWEWATVAVYSCSRSCGPELGSAWAEEQAFVQNE